MWRLLVLSLVIVGAAGCSETKAPSGEMVRISPGAKYTFAVEGTLEGSPITGEISIDIKKAVDEKGEPCLKEYVVYTLKSNGKSDRLTLDNFVRQDEQGSVYELGDSDEKWLKEPVLQVRSPLKVGDEYSTNSIYGSGLTTETTTKVVGVERVSVPAGTYTAFKLESKETSRRDGVLNAQEWWVPALGQPVKMIWTDKSGPWTLQLKEYTPG